MSYLDEIPTVVHVLSISLMVLFVFSESFALPLGMYIFCAAHLYSIHTSIYLILLCTQIMGFLCSKSFKCPSGVSHSTKSIFFCINVTSLFILFQNPNKIIMVKCTKCRMQQNRALDATIGWKTINTTSFDSTTTD